MADSDFARYNEGPTCWLDAVEALRVKPPVVFIAVIPVALVVPQAVAEGVLPLRYGNKIRGGYLIIVI